MRVDVYKSDEADVDEIAKLAERFFYESDFSKRLTVDIEKFKRLLCDYINHDDVSAITAVVDGKIVGYCLIYRQNDYTKEWVGEMFQFYVMPEYRKTIVARSLVKYVTQQYKKWGCARAYLDCSPGLNDINHLPLFKNLWSKFGYRDSGFTMVNDFE